MNKGKIFIICLISIILHSCQNQEKISKTKNFEWKNTSQTTKPWTRWWWMGNAVDRTNIKTNLIQLEKAGIGGVEITPIYGVKGEEENYIEFLSPEYLKILDYTIKTADSLGLGVDMVLGTGWPYGGPQVSKRHAATRLIYRTYKLKKGEKFAATIEPESEKDKTTATLRNVLAFSDDGNYIDLTDKLSKNNRLNWIAENSDYTLYAIFTGKTGQKVKRAAPGGQGFTVDHYAEEAFKAYVEPFNDFFSNSSENVRGIFNDSYEVYGTDFTPKLFEEFKKRRGYDLKEKIDLLLNKNDDEEGNRVKSDYRETLSDLLLNKFNRPWTEWANSHNFKTRLQAHGSPGNLIDLYASADIPECETFGSMPFDIPGLRREKEDIREGDADAVMLKFSSSAAHIAGKPLTSSETFTWLRDHFKTALSQTKPEVEELFLNGINHVFLHGTTYSPDRADWPGWKFYASVNFSPTNTIWEDAPELFNYISNAQSMLQAGHPDNDILLYWPVHDIWGNYLNGDLFFQLKIHSLDEWLHDTPFYSLTQNLISNGYAVDFISDQFIAKAKVENGKIKLPGGSFKSLVVPDSKHMPLKTLEKLIELKENGAHIIFNGLPETVPGMKEYVAQTQAMQTLIQEKSIGKVTINELPDALSKADIHPETLVETGLKYIRRDIDGEKIYFLVNHTSKTVDQFISLQSESKQAILFDPLTGDYGKAISKGVDGKIQVKVNIKPGQSYFIKTEENTKISPWIYYEAVDQPQLIKGKWKLTFEKGGPELPEAAEISTLASWTTLNNKAENFSGTATYEIEFEKPSINADSWKLNLGDVRESAKVWVNDNYIGTAWSVPFQLKIGQLKDGKNTLKIKVTNLAANRIRAKENRGEEWKIFHEINMVDKDYQKFDATQWDPMPSGLLGPVQLIPLKEIK